MSAVAAPGVRPLSTVLVVPAFLVVAACSSGMSTRDMVASLKNAAAHYYSPDPYGVFIGLNDASS